MLLLSSPISSQVLELHFLKDPPMMFWHMASALSLDYWIIPVPKAHWTIAEMEAPIEEVVAVVATALDYDTNKTTPTSECTAGLVPVIVDASVVCKACPSGKEKNKFFISLSVSLSRADSVSRIPCGCSVLALHLCVCVCVSPCLHPSSTGTFKALESDPFCSPCPPGQASGSGATYCTMCPIHHYQASESTCEKCPEGLLTWTPGASSVSDCITQEKQDELLKVTGHCECFPGGGEKSLAWLEWMMVVHTQRQKKKSVHTYIYVYTMCRKSSPKCSSQGLFKSLTPTRGAMTCCLKAAL